MAMPNEDDTQPMTLSARIIPPADLTPSEHDAMFALMDRNYENMQRDRFESDLSGKDWVILLVDGETGAVCGFSTQALLPLSIASRHVRCVFSGDTIVDREHWGSSALATGFGKLACQLIETYPQEELYWYLISKGFRTYRVLPVYFREFYPRFDAVVPADLQAVLEAVTQEQFPDRFDRTFGIVRAESDSDRLRSGVGEITPERLLDPHVRFFTERNPGHAQGDELCCIARLAYDNFSAVAERLIRSPAFTRQRVGSC